MTVKSVQDTKVMKYILWFDELDKSSINLAGGKGANLGEMVAIKLPIPGGFVVTTAAFEHFIKMNRLDSKINELVRACKVDDIEKLNETSKRIKRRIMEADCPLSVKQEITRAYKEMSYSRDIRIPAILGLISAGREMAIVAVRSSATTEDLATASFAGQQASFLNVKGVKYLLDAIKRCWASLYESRAIFYRAKKGFKSSSIAVIIQRMINADKAGVTFTVHPSTGENVIVHEACWGLGESLVLGKITPDRYIISKEDGKIIKKEIGMKETMHIRDIGTERTVEIRVPEEKRNMQILSERELAGLTKYAIAIEEHYGTPQDIEWAVRGSKIYILQTRPVTTVPKKKIVAKKDVGKIKEEIFLKGIAASPGIASGPVKIISSTEDAGKIVKGDVLVAEMTSPDLVPTMSKCVAIVTEKGGTTSHAAIVSREMGIPCIVGTKDATQKLKDGSIVTVDGTSGVIYKGKVELGAEAEARVAEVGEDKEYVTVKPSEKEKVEEIEKLEEMERELEDHIETMEEEIKKPLEKPKTKQKQKTKTKVYMNLGVPEKIDEYKQLPFEGIGLMRIEFIIAGLGTHPNALIDAGLEQKYMDAIAAGIEKVAAAISPRPVVVRFSDLKTNEYRNLKGGEKYEPQEANPMMGWRGASRYVTPEFEEAFRLECRAVKKVRGCYKNVWVMVPFVRTTDELKKCLKIMEEEGLKRGVDELKIWIMVEIPSVIFLAAEFAKLCDGLSIGSNDLTQFILGVDRDSEILGNLGYFNEQNKAVKIAIKQLIRDTQGSGCTVSICGQAPSVYPEFTKFLIKEGIDSISVNPDAVEKTRELVRKFTSP